jgi:hypothetical protein
MAGGRVTIDPVAFGERLGGWKSWAGRPFGFCEYAISGSKYRTFLPEVSPTPNGGIFVSVRIDHRRGMLANDDTASLEVTFGPTGVIESAQSVLGFQGRRITSDVIRGTTTAGTKVAGDAVGMAVKVGADLVADLSAKLLREQIVEPGRVTFPAAIRHNFNHLVAALKIEPDPPPDPPPGEASGQPADAPAAPAPDPPAAPAPATPPLEIKPFGEPKGPVKK